MNIFPLDKKINLSVSYHNDYHIRKIILESAQMLSMVHWLTETNSNKMWLHRLFYEVYNLTKRHINHPCSIWTRESLSNYKWLCEYNKQLCLEFTYRFGKKHKTEYIVDWLSNNMPNIPDIGMTKFAQAMPEDCKHINEVEAYRKYYITNKRHLAKWTKREVPYWYN